jgi:sucrose-6-phosphate hydrolase SacC (GH32 family)
VAAGATLPLEPAGRLFHIQAEVRIPDGAKLTFNIRGIPVILTSKTLESGTAPAPVADQINTVEILGDRTSIETFVNHGELSATRFVLPQENGLSVKADGGPATIQSLTVWTLNSAWTNSVANR